MFLNPFCNFREMLILLAYVIFLAEVDKVDNRFGSQ